MGLESGGIGQLASKRQLLRGEVGPDEHVGSAARATPSSYRGVGEMRSWWRLASKLLASEREESGTVGAGEIAEVADADEASRAAHAGRSGAGTRLRIAS